METAFMLNQKDSRVFMEYDQLKKKLNVHPEMRLASFEQYIYLVLDRDDLYVEYVTLQNLTQHYSKAKELIAARNFHPWEGGEGKISAQYICCHVELAKQAIAHGKFEEAVKLLQACTVFPFNLGEGKLIIAQENNIYYFMGCAYAGLKNVQKAKKCFEKASQGLSEPAGMMFYNDQPPETIFYQGLALLKLEKPQDAHSRFHKLISYGEKHLNDSVRIDYFAVSLPDLMIFDDDLNQKNRTHCMYMMALGHMGLGETGTAEEELLEIVNRDANHFGAMSHLELLQQKLK
jgi:tetratricopeptide (TPR) repeat protein